MSNVAKKIVHARANMVLMNPFFGTLALRMNMVPDENVESAVTDGQTLRYNPEFVEKQPLSKVEGMLAHTVMHPALLHHTRRGHRDIKKWNVACDHAVNQIIKSAGMDLPDGKNADPRFANMAAEQIYSILEAEQQDNGGGDGDGNGRSGAQDDKKQNSSGSNDGDVEDSPNSQNKGASASQQSSEESEWKQTLAQAAHAAKQAGKLPAGMERIIDDVLKPVLAWKDILRRFMTEKCNDDFTWKRGNRRFVAQGMYLPSRLSDDALGAMVVVIDTSGSITKEVLDEFGAEIKAIHQDTKPKDLYVIYCDADVDHVDHFGPEDELKFELHGGGGTDFRPPFQWLEQHMITPRVFAYLTDGYGPFPEVEPEYPVIWAINNSNVTPPFGEHFVLEE